jgi:hypothetical protein
MELDEILSALDRRAANPAKLERVWERAALLVRDGFGQDQRRWRPGRAVQVPWHR